MKGIELPVNVLVILAVAVLVMLGLIALYVASTPAGASIITQMELSSACSKFVQTGCENADGIITGVKNPDYVAASGATPAVGEQFLTLTELIDIFYSEQGNAKDICKCAN